MCKPVAPAYCFNWVVVAKELMGAWNREGWHNFFWDVDIYGFEIEHLGDFGSIPEETRLAEIIVDLVLVFSGMWRTNNWLCCHFSAIVLLNSAQKN